MELALRSGFSVLLCPDPVSTPFSYFTTLVASAENPRTMGLTVTASHNPASHVGIKFTVPIVRAIGLDCGPKGGLARIRELYHSKQRLPERLGGSLRVVDWRDEYIEFSSDLAGVAPGSLGGLRVVLDAFHGAAGPELYRGLERAGVTVIPHRLVPNGAFPTGSPNPTSQGKMNDAVTSKRRCAGSSETISPDGSLNEPLPRRLCGMRSSRPFRLTPLPAAPTSLQTEKARHRNQKNHRMVLASARSAAAAAGLRTRICV